LLHHFLCYLQSLRFPKKGSAKMSSLAEVPRGIPIPVEEIRAALESVAVPGYTGVLQLEFSLTVEAAQCVRIGVTRRQSKRVGDGEAAAMRQMLPDPERRKPVQKVLQDITGKLFIRSVMTALEVHVLDGVLQKITVQE
jgi:hypothetical protein